MASSHSLNAYRPLNLRASIKGLDQHRRWLKAAGLIKTFFPDLLPQALVLREWYQLLRFFLDEVDSLGWFDVDWRALETLEQGATTRDRLALVLTNIPVRTSGYPQLVPAPRPLTLLHYLLAPPVEETDILDEAGRAGLPAGFRWTQPDREAAWTRLEELDCATLTEPLCWLPEIGLYVTSLHPNDLRNGPTSPDDWSGGWFNWSDIITVRELWQEAQRLDRKVTRFIDWAADRTNLETIFALITGISATLPD